MLNQIELWNGRVPGAIDNPNRQETIDSEDGWTKLRFVTKPCMDVYPAPAELATGTAMVVCPGGGYWALSILSEGEKVARWLNGMGITAFILKYRLPDPTIMRDTTVGPVQDGQRAIRIVRAQANTWGIDPSKIGVMGFSAGGHLAATLSTRFGERFYETQDHTSARPDFSILIYPVISMDTAVTHLGSRTALLGENPSEMSIRRFSMERRVSGETPPSFLVHSMDDGSVPPSNSILYTTALQKTGVPCELHLYQSGGHGYDLGRSDNTESAWPLACQHWMRARGYLNKP